MAFAYPTLRHTVNFTRVFHAKGYECCVHHWLDGRDCAIVSAVLTPSLNRLSYVAMLVFPPVACFCLYGIMAAMELGNFHVAWRILCDRIRRVSRGDRASALRQTP